MKLGNYKSYRSATYTLSTQGGRNWVIFALRAKTSERLTQEKQPLKFERNPRIRYNDNWDAWRRKYDWQTDDGQISISWALLNQSRRAKNVHLPPPEPPVSGRQWNVFTSTKSMTCMAFPYKVRHCSALAQDNTDPELFRLQTQQENLCVIVTNLFPGKPAARRLGWGWAGGGRKKS